MSPKALGKTIFERARLRPSQLRTVAERRLVDAEYLCNSRLNRHANGAMYLGGFVIECLLKARLVEKHTWLKSAASPERLPAWQRNLWSLCYRRHDLDGLTGALPEILESLARARNGSVLVNHLRQICGQWTVFARYSPRTATIPEAKLKAWLQ